MLKLKILAAVAAMLAGSHAIAGEIVVLPSNVAASPILNQWYVDNFRGTTNGYSSTTTAAITGVNPRSGNGSVQMSLTDGSGKADYVYGWGFVAGRTLGNLSALSYDWYRSGNSSAAGFMPALRLSYDADGSAATTADRGYLVFEQVYNPNAASVVSDQWVSTDVMTKNMWQRQFSPGFTVESYGVSLADWISGSNQPDNADRLGANSAILGIEFGIGSGWNGSFNGFVDNVTYGFSGASTTFNFETASAAAVPEPGSFMLMGLGAFGLLAARKRKPGR